ncbi:DUF4190 domain-containing protein [Streptomyces sp. NBC_00887]|uniref:DUF4190 domain-containing protein n=1 Tax=Streptomyces sp. NBC_00887 TaxID=2975859 RepID=UPI00386AC744|nr:DUF4190 domain-containing protein [Streptomyces sp. NBC_00887]
MTLTTALARRTRTRNGTGAGAAPHDDRTPGVREASREASREADGLAVASFVLGLLGLLVMNILLGPVAIVMAVIALARSTARRGRALLGLALGIADLVVLAVLVTENGTVSWNFGG